VEDLVKIFKKVKPAVIVLPHPFLDNHLDHVFTAVAAVQALEKWKRSATFLLYTNHAAENLYPYGPAGTSAPLPPWAGRELAVEGFYAHPVSPGLQRRKLFAMETMHDLRLSPSEQTVCLTPDAKPDREDYPRIQSVDYFRRGPRPEELFFVFGREGVQKLVRTFLAEYGTASPSETARRQ
jgi:LmbE family N-acetylglucosaminyl deacetylase